MEIISVILAVTPLIALILLMALAVKRQRVPRSPREVDPFRGKPWSGGPDESGSGVPRKPLVPQGSASGAAVADHEEDAEIAAMGRPLEGFDDGAPEAAAR